MIYGAGPVGLMAAMSSMNKGASQVMVVDTHKDRLALAEKAGAIAIDDTEGEGVEKIMELTGGQGADRGCECVGYQYAEDKLEKRGRMGFDFGAFWNKGQIMCTGQANVKAYNRLLSRLIEKDRVKPSWIVSHELPLEKAPEAYANFDARKKGWTKVV